VREVGANEKLDGVLAGQLFPARPGLGVWSRAVFFVIEGGLPYLTRARGNFKTPGNGWLPPSPLGSLEQRETLPQERECQRYRKTQEPYSRRPNVRTGTWRRLKRVSNVGTPESSRVASFCKWFSLRLAPRWNRTNNPVIKSLLQSACPLALL
jgi:hypothetical protein